MSFHIRPATLEDAAAIAHVHVASWKTTYPGIVPEAALAALDQESRRQFWQQQLEASAFPVFIAESDSGVFGFLAGGPIRTPIDDYDAEVYAMYLLQDHHRKGAGRALLQQLAQTLHKMDHQSMLVWVLEANPAADFYRHLGAVPVTSQTIEIGGATLPELALGWPNLEVLLQSAAPK